MTQKKKTTRGLINSPILYLSATLVFFGGCKIPQEESIDENAVQIKIEPSVTREIGGISELNRNSYFALADNGTQIDKRLQNQAMYDYFTHELNVRFGRALGPIMGATKWGNYTFEDPERPGYVDLERLQSGLAKRVKTPSEQMLEDYGSNLDVAAHGHQEAWPEYMGQHSNKESLNAHHGKSIPENIDASAELAVNVFKHGYSDFNRPRYYEPVNEPHWSFFNSQQLADWHLGIHDAFKEELPEVLVGGHCMSVAYMYKNDYRSWNGMRDFINNTQGQLDFYSFHVYDYILMNDDGEFGGSIQSGLPIEGVLDLIPSHTMIEFGKETPMVISEHGGYVTGRGGKNSDDIADAIAAQHFPGEGFEWEMKKRAVMNHQGVRSMLTNTLAFMEHPHTLKKAVPFILLHSFSWDPTYYATVYVPYDYTDKSRWYESANVDYYKLFKDLKGRRVYLDNTDPDIQARAFVDGSSTYIVLNNLHNATTPLAIDLPKAKSYSLRRYGKNADYTPYLKDEVVDSLKGLSIGGFETIIITANYKQAIKEHKVLNEIANYADRTIIKVAANTSEDVHVQVAPKHTEQIEYATLRVSIRRPAGSELGMSLQFNGTNIEVPIEDSAYRLQNEKEYASTRFVSIDPSLIQENNVISIAFPDGQDGSVGSVVLRTATQQ